MAKGERQGRGNILGASVPMAPNMIKEERQGRGNTLGISVSISYYY